VEFADKQAELAASPRSLATPCLRRPAPVSPEAAPASSSDAPGAPLPRRRTAQGQPKGRLKVGALLIEETRYESTDPDLECKPSGAGFERAIQLGWRKGGPVRIRLARAK